MGTLDKVKGLVENPPKEYRSAPFWGWNDRLQKENLGEQIEGFKKAGMGGFFIHSREGLETEYLSTEWMEDVKFCVDKAQENDLELWIYDEDKWPSGGTAEGRTQAENQMFNWLSRLLHWRQGNEVITKGKQTQFCPQKGVYVIARQYKGKNVMTVINGKNEANELNVSRYAEIIGSHDKATDVTNGRTILINKNVKLRPRQSMILEF